MYLNIIYTAIIVVFIFSGCSEHHIAMKENKKVVYTPMKLSEIDNTLDEKENTEILKRVENESNEPELSDYQRHMLYKDYKIVK